MPNLNDKTAVINGRNPLAKNNRPPFARCEATEAALWLQDGEYHVGFSGAEEYAGTMQDGAIIDFSLNSDKPKLNAIVANHTDTVIFEPKIELSGVGCSDFSCKGAAILAMEGAKVDVRGGDIVTRGCTRAATIATSGATLKVWGANLASHGGPLPEDYVPVIGPGMMEPPAPLGLGGNCRTHLSMDNSESYFYSCKIYADAWAALSTDSSGGYVYLEANDCTVDVKNNGYVIYSDNGCHVTLNRCTISSGNVFGIQDGNSTVSMRQVTGNAKGYGFLIHGGMHDLMDIGTVRIAECDLTSAGPMFRCKSTNADIYVKDSKLTCTGGVLLETMLTDDQHYYQTRTHGPDEYGVQFTFENTELYGDMNCLDPERKTCLNFVSTALTGAITGNPILRLTEGSTFVAIKDSEITLVGSHEGIDASAGVTVTATCGKTETISLPSGGTLVLK